MLDAVFSTTNKKKFVLVSQEWYLLSEVTGHFILFVTCWHQSDTERATQTCSSFHSSSMNENVHLTENSVRIYCF